MAELIPGWIAGTVPANVHRMIHAATFLRAGAAGVSGQVSARSGMLGTNSLKVSPSSGLTLTISSGAMVLQGSGTTQGAYVLVNSADDTVTLAAANATLARKDAVVARVFDTTDGVSGNGNQWLISAITGTPAASPSLPSLPTDAVLLGEINVAANASSLVAGNIVDRRVFTVAQGGILPTTSTALPTSPDPGQATFLTDTKVFQVWDGSAYQRLYEPRVWTDLTLSAPWTISQPGNYPSLGYSARNGLLSLRGVIRSNTTLSDTTAGSTVATLPVGFRPSSRTALALNGSGGLQYRVDVLTTGQLQMVAAQSPVASMIFDAVNIPLG